MTHNLANLPREERDRIEMDKARWFIAHQWLTRFTRTEIAAKLAAIESAEEQADMRRRLNQMRTRPRYQQAQRDLEAAARKRQEEEQRKRQFFRR